MTTNFITVDTRPVLLPPNYFTAGCTQICFSGALTSQCFFVLVCLPQDTQNLGSFQNPCAKGIADFSLGSWVCNWVSLLNQSIRLPRETPESLVHEYKGFCLATFSFRSISCSFSLYPRLLLENPVSSKREDHQEKTVGVDVCGSLETWSLSSNSKSSLLKQEEKVCSFLGGSCVCHFTVDLSLLQADEELSCDLYGFLEPHIFRKLLHISSF